MEVYTSFLSYKSHPFYGFEQHPGFFRFSLFHANPGKVNQELDKPPFIIHVPVCSKVTFYAQRMRVFCRNKPDALGC
jgi:hypothetical protein